MVVTTAPQAWATARAWADPPTREEGASLIRVAFVETENVSSELAVIATLLRVSQAAAPPRSLAAQRSIPPPVQRVAKLGRLHRPSRYVVLQAPRRKRLHEPRPNSPAVAAVSEPASLPVEAEPIEFSLATRGD
jgi:hypothetical protein